MESEERRGRREDRRRIGDLGSGGLRFGFMDEYMVIVRDNRDQRQETREATVVVNW